MTGGLCALFSIARGMVGAIMSASGLSAMETAAPPVIADDALAAAAIVRNYVGETIFNLLVGLG